MNSMDVTKCTCGEDLYHQWACPGNIFALLDSQESEESQERNQEHTKSEKDRERAKRAKYWIERGVKDEEEQVFLDDLVDLKRPEKRPAKESQRNQERTKSEKVRERAKRAKYWIEGGVKDKEAQVFLDDYLTLNGQRKDQPRRAKETRNIRNQKRVQNELNIGLREE